MHIMSGKQHPSEPKDAFLPISFGTEERLFCSSKSCSVHKCEVNQHITISLWFSDCLYSFSKLISGRGII